MTGSHNLGYKASSENDDNLVIVEGNAPLAAAYAINIISIYQTYRWNSYVEAHRQNQNVWHGLADSDAWQASYLTGDGLAEIRFWMGQTTAGQQKTAAAGAATQSANAAHTIHSSSSRNSVAAPVGKTPAKKTEAKKPPAKSTAKAPAAKKKAAAKKSVTKKSVAQKKSKAKTKAAAR